MLRIALQMVRARWVGFAGMFVALCLGVGLMSSFGLVLAGTVFTPQQSPKRFAATPAVVRAATPQWAMGLRESDRPHLGISAATAAKLAATGSVIVDRTFYAQMSGGPANQVGHPWSAAAVTPYQLVSGVEPRLDSEVVVSEGSAQVGERVTVLTASSVRSYTVSGLVRSVAFESALFFTDKEAARLSPRIDAVASYTSTDILQNTVGDSAQILTGADRRKLDPDLKQYQQSLNSTAIIAAMAAGLAVFVSTFVIASTFAFSVVQRLRELALFRLVGATPKQVRWMVFSEALVVSVIASAAGCVLGWLGAPFIARLLADLRLAPVGFEPSSALWPVLIAFVVGLGVALLGARASSRRASRIRAIDALREAAIERTTMTRGRWIFGLALLGVTLLAMAGIAFALPHLATVPFIYLWVLMVPIAAFALLAPVVVVPITRFVALPFNLAKNATATLIRANTFAAVRRTAATATPVLLIVGLCVSLLSAVATINQASATEAENVIQADYVITPVGSPGITGAAIAGLRAIKGVTLATQTSTIIYAADDHDSLRRYNATAIEPDAFTETSKVPLISGSFANLRDDTIIVSEGLGKSVGQSLDLWLSDGSSVTLRVAGVLKPGVAGPGAYLADKYRGDLLPRIAYAKTDGTIDLTTKTLQTSLQGVHIAHKDSWVADTDTSTDQAAQLGLLAVLGITVLYSAIVIVNTMVMAAAGRVRDFATLRLSGATMAQILWIAAGEALLAAFIGVVLATCVFVIDSAGLQLALAQLVTGNPLVVPWLPIIVITCVSMVLAIGASTVPIYLSLRKGRFMATERLRE